MSDDAVHRLCTFRLAGLLLGVPVTMVREVLRIPKRTRIPGASAMVGGLINLRGEIVTTIDLGHWLVPGGAGVTDDRDGSMGLVARLGADLVCVLIDEIGDIVEVSPQTLEPVPSTVGRELGDLAVGIHQLDGALLVLLDLDRLVDLLTASIPTRSVALV